MKGMIKIIYGDLFGGANEYIYPARKGTEQNSSIHKKKGDCPKIRML